MFANLTKPPAGWYPDNVEETMERYWDGVVWTLRTRPVRSATAAIQRMHDLENPPSWNRTSWSKASRETARKERDKDMRVRSAHWDFLTPAEERSRERVEEKKAQQREEESRQRNQELRQRRAETLRNKIEDVHSYIQSVQDSICGRVADVAVHAAKQRRWTHVAGFDHARFGSDTGELHFWIRDANDAPVTGLSVALADLLSAPTRKSPHFRDAWQSNLDELLATTLDRINDDLRPAAQRPAPGPVSADPAEPPQLTQPSGPSDAERLASALRGSVAGKSVRKVLLVHTGSGRSLADIRFTDNTSTQVNITDAAVVAVLRSENSNRIESLRAAASHMLGGV